MEKAFYTEKELAARWELQPKTLREWRNRKDGDYPTFIKIGGAVRYPVAEVERYEKDRAQ